ncbi:MAG: hypothetical protein A2175_01425 [Candidatus Nealsonbacteria bacterium RBG_13_42_11]|uniref:Uncharacterized protein n=1 Tax=Candidatus Nealsonbacteria bacterium RBG_13_42_11 TaxID=1801663 RepID=A0A1G2E140_9BACT|nr:MAG: hypothetical protein A2175_01425 [Candidatus Nealsonbacteria bacterium RBG_13_42_11]
MKGKFEGKGKEEQRTMYKLEKAYNNLETEITGGRKPKAKIGEEALRTAVKTLKQVKTLQRDQQLSFSVIDRVCKKAQAVEIKHVQSEVGRILNEAAVAIAATNDFQLIYEIRRRALEVLKVSGDSQKRPQALLALREILQSKTK